jgi:hypothetical protein
MMRYSWLLLACCVFHAASAQTVYKCTADGKTSYADRPCARGASVVLPPPAGVDASTGSVRTDDSRALLELEKLRLEREKRAQQAEREDKRAVRLAATRRKQCERLRLHVRWAEEDVARMRGRSQEQARTRLRRRRETLAVECPA